LSFSEQNNGQENFFLKLLEKIHPMLQKNFPPNLMNNLIIFDLRPSLSKHKTTSQNIEKKFPEKTKNGLNKEPRPKTTKNF